MMNDRHGLVPRMLLFLVCVVALVGVSFWLWPKVTGLSAQVEHASGLTPTATASPATTVTAAAGAGANSSPHEEVTQSLVWLLGVSIVLCVLLFLLSRRGGIGRGHGRKTHGSAHFATGSELRAFRPTVWEQITRQTGPRLVIGKKGGRLISLSQRQQESNILLTAPVGSGKSSAIIIPNILRERGQRSLFIPDVKGELLKITGGAVSRFYAVWVFAPMRPEQSQGYNPLAFVRTVADAQDLAHCWVVNTGQSQGDAFWSNAAKKLITAVILHLRAAEPTAPFSRIAELLVHTPQGQLREILVASPDPACVREAVPFFEYLEQNERMGGAIMADISTRFQLLLSEEIRQVTANNDLDFRAMAERPVVLYLSIPRRGAARCQPLLACFTMQMFNEWERRSEEEQIGRLPIGVMCYMDEFANLGYIPGFDSYISTARASGVAMLLAVQSLSQIDNRYGKALRNIILSNTVTHLLLPGGGQEETEYYSARIGNATVRTESYSDNSRGGNHSEGEASRRLMTVDELRTMRAGTILVLPGANAPALLRTLPYYKDRRLARLAYLPLPTRQESISEDKESAILPDEETNEETNEKTIANILANTSVYERAMSPSEAAAPTIRLDEQEGRQAPAEAQDPDRQETEESEEEYYRRLAGESDLPLG